MKKALYILIAVLAALAGTSYFYYSTFPTATPALVAAPKEEAPLPVTLEIPKLNISAPIEHVGVTKDRDMDTPKDSKNAGWYKYGTVPGERGSAVAAGHLDNQNGTPAVFARLSELTAGDDVYVVNEKGERLHFKVTGKKSYDYDIPDTKEIFGPAPVSRLNLITCNGAWLKGQSVYSKRLVVFTELQTL